MSDLIPFQFEAQQVRVIDQLGEPWFVLNDVCGILGIENPRNVSARLDDDMKGVHQIDTLGGRQNTTIISESGFYEVVIRSDSPLAKPLRRWVVAEVLPSIRKTGGYGRPQIDLSHPEGVLAMAEQFTNTARQLVEAHREIEYLAPRAAFADAVSASHSSILVGELAKILRGNGVNIGQNRLFERLRNEGYLIKREGTDYNMPTQRSMDLGLFKIKETTVRHSDGHVTINKTPKVTGKGQTYFVDRYLGRDLVESEAC